MDSVSLTIHIIILYGCIHLAATSNIHTWPHPLLQHNCPSLQSLSLLQAPKHAPKPSPGVGHSSCSVVYNQTHYSYNCDVASYSYKAKSTHLEPCC